MGTEECMFGVNFAIGRIECYPIANATFFAFYVRGDIDYGKNDFEQKDNLVIKDKSSNLEWMQQDSGMNLS